MRACWTRRPSSSAIALLAWLVIAALSTPLAVAQTPEQDGQWSAPFDLPLIAIHAAMLPSGKVLLFSAEHGVPGIHGWLLDPETLELTNVPPPSGWNPDCAGHSFLADGRLLVAGGTLQFNPTLGTRLAFVFDPFSEAWVQVEDMARGRWYPTNITLPDGVVMTLSGLNDSDGELNPDVEFWNPLGNSNWNLVGQKTVPYYPYLHVLESGMVFRSGPDPQTETFDPGTGTWTPVATTNFPGRYEACSVLISSMPDRVMLIGGYRGIDQPTNSAEIIDVGDDAPQWTGTAHMQFARLEHNAVLLPDGKVLVVGGRSSANGGADSVMIPELFDPAVESWESLAPHQVRRMYHSTATLLPDGRILAAGGDNRPSGEIYSPPYLFQTGRPVIQSAPATITYGDDFSLEFSSSTDSNAVVLVRLSSVTHSVNMGQRIVPLARLADGGGPVMVSGPAHGALAPPGYYMLFVVDDDGAPSVSRIVQVVAPGPSAVVAGHGGRASLQLGPIKPNPFRTRSLVSFRVPKTGWVRLSVYDLMGRRVAHLFEGVAEAGWHARVWSGRGVDGRLLAAGAYLVKLWTLEQATSEKVILLH